MAGYEAAREAMPNRPLFLLSFNKNVYVVVKKKGAGTVEVK